MKIGVFDSGVGGLSVATAIMEALPGHQIILYEDKKNLPYGNKKPDTIFKLVLPILQSLVDEGCEVVVIACNTVTTTLIDELRSQLPVPLVGIEPQIEPAAKLTKSKVIAICATPTTLASQRYKSLKERHAKDITVIEPDCSDWSYMIEHNLLDRQKIANRLKLALDKGADVIVLGCTHYHWIEQTIRQLVRDKAVVLQPEQAVIKRLWQVIEPLG